MLIIYEMFGICLFQWNQQLSNYLPNILIYLKIDKARRYTFTSHYFRKSVYKGLNLLCKKHNEKQNRVNEQQANWETIGQPKEINDRQQSRSPKMNVLKNQQLNPKQFQRGSPIEQIEFPELSLTIQGQSGAQLMVQQSVSNPVGSSTKLNDQHKESSRRKLAIGI